MSESEGSLTPPAPSALKCVSCGGHMKHQTWESNDGTYEDSKYSCADPKCGYVHWVDGIDS